MVGELRIFKDVISSIKLKQFVEINGLTVNNRGKLGSTITDHLLSFVPLQYPLSKDGFFDYLIPSKIDSKYQSFLNDNKRGAYWRRVWGGGSMKLFSSIDHNKVYTCFESIKSLKRTSNGTYVILKRDIVDTGDTRVHNYETSSPLLLLQEIRTLVYTDNEPTVNYYGKLSKDKNLSTGQIIKTFGFEIDNITKYNILSSNPHKVHWDKNYAVSIEKYKDIIVPGPYILQLTTHLIEPFLDSPLTNIKYRNVNFIYPGTAVNLVANSKFKTFWLIDKNDPRLIYFILNIEERV